MSQPDLDFFWIWDRDPCIQDGFVDIPEVNGDPDLVIGLGKDDNVL